MNVKTPLGRFVLSKTPSSSRHPSAARAKGGFAWIAAASLGLASLHAASGDWNVNADGVWSDAGNWTPGVADGATFTANLLFNLTANRIVTLDGARSIGVLNIGDSNASNTYTLATGTNVLTFDNGSSDSQLNQVSTSNGDTVSGLLAIGGNGNLTVANAASGKTLNISAGITSSLASGTQNLTFNNTGAVSVTGVIGNGGSGGTVAVTKSGTGALTLNAANSFTGGLTIKGGTVTGGSNAASFGAGGITIGDGSGGSANATLSGGAATYTNAITVAGTNTGTATITTSGVGATTFNGGVTLNSHDLTIQGGYVALTLGTGISGTGNVTLSTVSGSSQLITLNGTLNFTGTFTNSGAGTPNNGNAINASFGANVTGIIQDSTSSQVTLYGNNSSYNNGILIKKGQLNGSATNALGANTNVVTLGDSSGSANTTLGGKGNYANAIQVAAGNTGVATITNTYSNSAGFSGLVTLNSHDLTVSTLSGAGSRDLTMSGGTVSTGTGGNLTIKVGGAHSITFSGAALNHAGSITNSGTGSFAAIISSVIGSNVTGVIQNSATSALTLGGANLYSGPTTVTLGTLATNATGTFGSSSVTVASGALLTLGNNASFGNQAVLTFASTSTAGSINLNFTGADTLGAVYDSVTATYLAAGTYTASELNSAFSSSVFAGTGSFTVSAVPEPSAYAAIAGGMALLGGVWRSRRRRG